MKLINTIPALLLLAACGGSSTSPNASFQSLDTKAQFADGGGVIDAAVAVDGVTVKMALLVDDVNESIQAANDFESYVQSIDFEADLAAQGVVIVDETYGSTSYGEYGVLTYTHNGQQNKLYIYGDDWAEVGLVMAAGSLSNAVVAFGTQVSGLPSGSYTYNGSAFTKGKTVTDVEVGTFSLTADFNTGLASFSAQTATTNLTGSNIDISSTGVLRGRNMTMTSAGVTSYSAGLDGNFHDSFANGVSGVYYNNAAYPTTIGAFAGRN